MNRKLIKEVKDDVKKQIDSIKGLDLSRLKQQLDFLNHYSDHNTPYFAEATQTINNFIKQIETHIDYAR
jgi:hypothetical protein